MPHLSVNITAMGNSHGYYTHQVDLVSKEHVQIRDNAIESSRMAVNKMLETKIPNDYFFFVRVYPHHVVRAVKLVLGAGADRIQKGMKHAWGKPIDRAARLQPGTIVYRTHVKEGSIPLVKAAYRIAKIKLPGRYSVVVSEGQMGVPPVEE
jgi:large subunit ribosomal protein L10e